MNRQSISHWLNSRSSPQCTKIKDKDKDKDVFIGPKEFVSHMMMTQTKYRLYHQLK